LLDARRFLEVPLAGLAARHAAPDTALRLQEAIETAAGHRPGSEPFDSADARFHRILAESAGNPLLRAFTDWILEVLQPKLVEHISGRVDGEAILRRHRDLQRAVRRGQPAAAERAMAAHIGYLKDLVG
jgi:GntR family transcriptional regulator, transcriptional repressor for pyruvate dehydrogenase complex